MILFCTVLALITVISSSLAFYYHQRLNHLLNPPLLPLSPVSQIEYAYSADYDTGTFQLAMELHSDQLQDWDVVATLSAYDLDRNRPVPVMEESLLFLGDTATLCFEDIPFEPYHDIYINISYAHDLLEAEQELLIIHPKGKNRPMWETQFPRFSGLTDYEAVENPALLAQE